jgi:glycosyltransferase involved in cell wall biosynthesis
LPSNLKRTPSENLDACPAEPSFSAVIPTLARPDLVRAVRSVLSQTLVPDEVIVVNNGPLGSDAAAVLREGGVLDDRISVVTLPPFSGPGFSRNYGAWRAASTYIAFLDDDDDWAPDYLQKMAGSIQDVGAEILFGTRVFLDQSGGQVRMHRADEVPTDRWLNVLLDGRNPGVGGQNMTVQREAFFEVGGFPVDLTSGEDRHFTIRMLRAGKALATVAEAVVYQRDPTGYRASGRVSNWINDVKILADHWNAMGWQSRRRHARMVVARTRGTLAQRKRETRSDSEPVGE